MKLEEAIRILTSASNQFNIVGEGNLKKALELGIEALKAVKEYRIIEDADEYMLLPGETED